MPMVTWVMLSLQCFSSSWILSLNFTISSRFFLTSSGGNSMREPNFCIDEGGNCARNRTNSKSCTSNSASIAWGREYRATMYVYLYTMHKYNNCTCVWSSQYNISDGFDSYTVEPLSKDTPEMRTPFPSPKNSSCRQLNP